MSRERDATKKKYNLEKGYSDKKEMPKKEVRRDAKDRDVEREEEMSREKRSQETAMARQKDN